MNIKRIVIISVVAVFLVAVVVVGIVMFPWISVYVGGLFSKNPATPEVTYGEFPYSITLSIDGGEKVFEGVYVCEYDGSDWNEGVGKHNAWKGTVKGSDESAILVIEDGNTKVFCSVGKPEYYMGDKENYSGTYPAQPNLYAVTEEDGITFTEVESVESAYKIKIVSWELSEPITNSFPEYGG